MNVNVLEISEKIYEHYENTRESVMHYYGILAIYALVKTAELSEMKTLTDKCRNILNKFLDEIDHPKYNLQNYTICGLAKAYANMIGIVSNDDQVRYYAEELMNAPRDDKGILCRPSDPNRKLIWIDMAAFATPFLLFAGIKLNEIRYIEEAVTQTILMYDEFLDHNNGLLHQSKNFNGDEKYSEDHWSRGNGWGYIAISELILHLDKNSPYRAKVEEYYINHSKAFLPYQSENGLWRQEITIEELDGLISFEEISGTGLILYGIGIGLRLGILNKEIFYPVFEKGIRGLMKIGVNSDFSTDNCCPGCLCPGEGEEKGTIRAYLSHRKPYRDEPHGAAPVMLALTEAYLNGIKEL